MKKAICVLMVMIFALALFVACDENKDIDFDAVMYDRAVDWMSEQFLSEQPDISSDIYTRRTVTIVRDETTFDNTFDEFPPQVDFEKEMLVVYVFCDIYNGFSCYLKGVKLNEQTLSVTLLHELAEPNEDGIRPPSTSQPTQRCLVIKMAKNNATTVDVQWS